MKIGALYRKEKEKLPEQKKLQESFESAARFGEMRIGQDGVFYRAFLRVRYAAFAQCECIYKRLEFGEYGDLPLHEHYIVLHMKDHKEIPLRFERPDDCDGAMAYLRAHAGAELQIGRKKGHEEPKEQARGKVPPDGEDADEGK